MRGQKHFLPALAALALLSLGGLARAAPCEQRSPTVFVLSGETTQVMADCVAAKLQPTTTELVVDSPGGPSGAAMDIAERLSGLRDLTIRVDGECTSSCANYFLPLGRRLLVGRQAIIMVHGGMDPAQVAKVAPSEKAAIRALADKQLAFALKHKIPPGWLLYRTAAAPTRVDGLDGAYRWRTKPEAELYLVEAPMLRSCLPGLDVTAYETWLNGQLSPERIARLKNSRIAATGTVFCNGQGW
ncbi:hypothetical protein [Caulobacter sp. FWC2]|uniref:hypothetical protein n=1 Tax=Caulobacter sp. FWC2 TaxID=69664 RepID=UPI000C14B593|nr:hypothetical protein [Caulobacter sp. FWC2]PIB93698.1 hypothetical protein CSW62_20240 [Caulobacter sp. FWC2]